MTNYTLETFIPPPVYLIVISQLFWIKSQKLDSPIQTIICRAPHAWCFTRRLPPCPLVIALVSLKCSSRSLQFPHRVPFTKEKMPWCPFPFKKEASRPGMQHHYRTTCEPQVWFPFLQMFCCSPKHRQNITQNYNLSPFLLSEISKAPALKPRGHMFKFVFVHLNIDKYLLNIFGLKNILHVLRFTTHRFIISILHSVGFQPATTSF